MPRLRMNLRVKTTNSGEVSFVNATVVSWLRANASRADVPYRIILDPELRPQITHRESRFMAGEDGTVSSERSSSTGFTPPNPNRNSATPWPGCSLQF